LNPRCLPKGMAQNKGDRQNGDRDVRLFPASGYLLGPSKESVLL
jgi:hypothetical protein